MSGIGNIGAVYAAAQADAGQAASKIKGAFAPVPPAAASQPTVAEVASETQRHAVPSFPVTQESNPADVARYASSDAAQFGLRLKRQSGELG